MSSLPAVVEELVSRGKISPDDLGRAAIEQRRTKASIEDTLIDLGLVSDAEVLEVKAALLKIPYVAIETLSPDPSDVVVIPEAFALDRAVMCIERAGSQLTVAMADPRNMTTLDEMRGLLKVKQMTICMASKGAILKKLAEYHDHYKAAAVEQLLITVQDQGTSLTQRLGLSVGDLGDIAGQVPIVKAVNLMLLQGLQKRASDIHIIPAPRAIVVKYRVDGVLVSGQNLPLNIGPGVVNRVKILAKLDISERRLPQDGSFHITIENREIDFRVATTPTIHGEKVVMRILDRHGSLLGLETLGFGRESYLKLRRNIRRTNGILLMVGPTGSGKTTTLYAALSSLSSETKNITTVEDPVEYNLEGITQIQANADIGLTFANALRSILRQDPDIILVGEIRDRETAEIAMRAAFTGHLVFATLHANDAVSAITRLLEMGMEPFLIASALRCVVSQRLVRTICSKCREVSPAFKDLSPALKLKLHGAERLWRGRGCLYCFQTGYRGRTVISEVLELSDTVRRQIVERAPTPEITHQAHVEGMQPMFQEGLAKVAEGITTLDEVLSVCDDLMQMAG